MVQPVVQESHADMRQGDWMQTYSGYQFWPLDPMPEDVHILDIAHALSNQCRFAGHCRTFYSVAQHSVIVSQVVPLHDALWGLLHDAAEAYLVDLPRPLKRHSEMGRLYQAIEGRLVHVICERFGLPTDEPESVRLADDVVLMTEKRDLMPGIYKWSEVAEPLSENILCLNPIEAEDQFILRAEKLGLTL